MFRNLRLSLLLLLPFGSAFTQDATPPPIDPTTFTVNRPSLGAFAAKVQQHQPVTIGFLGGSITLGSGASTYRHCYRDVATQALTQALRQQGVTLRTVHAAIGGTTSTFGAYRVGAQLLPKDPDMLIVEFAVNDHARPTIDGVEGIVRQAKAQRADIGIVFLYTVNAAGIKDAYDQGKLPEAVLAQHRVAQHYGLGEVLTGPRVVEGLHANTFTVASFLPDGTHPSDIGHALYANMLTSAILGALQQPASAAPGPRTLPPPLGSGRLARAHLTPPPTTPATPGWTVKGDQWNWYGVPILDSTQADAPITCDVPAGEDIALIYLGAVRVRWTTANGKAMEKLLNGKFGLPFPAVFNFPADAQPAHHLTVEVVPDDKHAIHGQVWGFQSIQPQP